MATYTWNTGSSGLWGMSGNWTPAGPPGSADTALINAGSVTIAAGIDFTVNKVVMQSTAGTFDVFGGITTNSSITVNDGLLSALNGGTIVADGPTNIAASVSTDVGTIDVSGANALFNQTASGINVGVLGAGLLEAINGGTIIQNGTNVGLTAGVSAGSEGMILVSGTGTDGSSAVLQLGTNAKGITVGNSGTGTLEVETGGTVQMVGTGGIEFGANSASTGLGIVSGPNALITYGTNAGGLRVGAAGAGTVVVQDGAEILMGGTGSISAGETVGSSGLIIVTGTNSVLNQTANGTEDYIGENGTGTLEVLAGGAVTLGGTRGVAIGTTGGHGTILVDAGTLSVAQGIIIGSSGSGTMTVQDGGQVTNSGSGPGVGTRIGYNPGSSGSLTINGGTLTNTSAGFSVGNTNASGYLLLENSGSLAGELVTGGPGGNAFSDINATGTGTAQATLNGGTWVSYGSIIVGDTGTGSLTINGGGLVNAGTNTVSISNQASSTGIINVNSGTLIAGTLNVMNFGTSGTLAVGSSGVVNVTSARVASGGDIALAGGSLDSTAAVSLNSGGVISGFGTMQASIADSGSIDATSGTLEVTGSVTGNGTLYLDLGAELKVDGSIYSSATVSFNPGTSVPLAPDETLVLGTPGAGSNFFTAINGLAQGDRIEFNFGGPSITAATVNNTGSVITVDLSNSQTYQLNDVTYAPGSLTGLTWGADTTTGDQYIQIVCFARHTRIATPCGEVPVEHLAVGDLVETLDGKSEPVVWIGVGRVLVPPGQRSAATPVIVRKGALAENVPHRDLRVTKAHSLFIDGALIPVEFLVNHRSIVWDDRAREIEIYHIELARHGVLLADGAPAESYRDDGNRWLFHNANSGWHLPPQPPCVPVLTGGELVDTVWRRLLDRAGPRPGLPTTDDPDLHLLVDGQRVDASERQGLVHIFRLPALRSCVQIVSREGVPAELGLARDPRSLGVALRQMAVCQGMKFEVMFASDARLSDGFHLYEESCDLRWTDGRAAVPVALFEQFTGEVELVLTLAATTTYPDYGPVVVAA